MVNPKIFFPVLTLYDQPGILGDNNPAKRNMRILHVAPVPVFFHVFLHRYDFSLPLRIFCDFAAPAPFWTIHSERGIQIIIRASIRNAEKEIIIIAGDLLHIRPVARELKTSAKRVNLSILVPDKSAAAGLGLQVRAMGMDLIALIEEMHASGSVMHYDRVSGECFMLTDGSLAISIRYHAGKKNVTVIRMPTLCYMMRKLIEMTEPEIGAQGTGYR
jgi:hypothetical protein